MAKIISEHAEITVSRLIRDTDNGAYQEHLTPELLASIESVIQELIDAAVVIEVRRTES